MDEWMNTIDSAPSAPTKTKSISKDHRSKIKCLSFNSLGFFPFPQSSQCCVCVVCLLLRIADDDDEIFEGPVQSISKPDEEVKRGGGGGHAGESCGCGIGINVRPVRKRLGDSWRRRRRSALLPFAGSARCRMMVWPL